jgi:hypothetical protein
VPFGAVADGKLIAHRLDYRTAMGPGQQVLLSKLGEITADGRTRHSQLCAELLDRGGPVAGQMLENHAESFELAHYMIITDCMT